MLGIGWVHMQIVQIVPVSLGGAATARAESHAALRRVVGARLCCAPADVPVTFVAGAAPSAPGLALSLSHTDGLAVIAVGARGVGVDVESMAAAPAGDELADLAQLTLSVAERAQLLRLPRAERPRHWLQLWTRKEAVFKASELRDPALRDVDSAVARELTVLDLDVGPGYVGALAVADA